MAFELSAGKESAQSFRPASVANNFNKTFEGTLDNRIRIRMNLIRKGNDLSGSYFYEKYKKNIALSGDINENGYFEMEERDDKNQITGAFHGAFISDEAIVGFWNKDDLFGSILPFQLIESGKQTVALITDRNRPVKIECEVKNNNGSLTILLIGDLIVGLGYQNVGGNAHTCSMYVDRREKGVVWQDRDQMTKITFTKEYFNDDQSAEVSIKKSQQGYDITFTGYLTYFCGVRSILPPKVTVYKSGKIWIGKS